MVCQNLEVYVAPLSDIITSGIPCAAMTVLCSIYARCSVVDLSWYGMKYVYFVSRSVTVHMESYSVSIISSLDKGNLVTRSNAISYHGLSNGFIDCSLPYGACRSYFIPLHLSHSLTIFFAVRTIPGK